MGRLVIGHGFPQTSVHVLQSCERFMNISISNLCASGPRVPYIAMYRKEECLSLFKNTEHDTENTVNKSDQKPAIRWHKLLWAIVYLYRKWLLLQKQQNNFQLYYKKRYEENSCNIYDETKLTLNKKLLESIGRSLKAEESDREVHDVDSKFNLHFPPGEVGVDERKYKRPPRTKNSSEKWMLQKVRAMYLICKHLDILVHTLKHVGKPKNPKIINLLPTKKL